MTTTPFAHAYTQAKLGEVAAVVSGVTKGRRLPVDTTAVPHLLVAKVQLGHINLSEVKEITCTAEEFRL